MADFGISPDPPGHSSIQGPVENQLTCERFQRWLRSDAWYASFGLDWCGWTVAFAAFARFRTKDKFTCDQAPFWVGLVNSISTHVDQNH